MCGSPDQATIDREGIPAGASVIQGLILSSEEPVPGGYVRLLDSGGEFTAEVMTSATGQFRFYARPGDWTVRVIAGGGHAGAQADVSLSEAEVSEIRLSV